MTAAYKVSPHRLSERQLNEIWLTHCRDMADWRPRGVHDIHDLFGHIAALETENEQALETLSASEKAAR